jgi:hypothetical protein
MKTQTKSKILQIIEGKGKIRPFDLQKSLGISAQAIHRHLRDLAKKGIIEAKGSSPFTQYALAGVPDLDRVSHWMKAPKVTHSPDPWVCETREIFSGRLPHLKSFTRDGLPENLLPLVISTAGEVGNNSFDHNLGQWRDVPGCWFEAQVTGHHLWVCIADRGQGVYRSLTKVHPELADDQTALTAAFETVISGRAPEQRGNGLKFVRQSVAMTPGAGITAVSGAGRVFYGEQGEKCMAMLAKQLIEANGTVTLMVWRLP